LSERVFDTRDLQQRLLAWYDKNKRDLPWRADKDPYRIWVSEIMLQQTRVDTVIPFYERFIATLPDISSLAEVSDDVLLKLWEGLGYYRRAANLKKGAQALVLDHGGRMPDDVRTLLTLPGIGPYTAGAIASIAFQKCVPAADGNVFRILSRVMALPGCIDDAAVKKELTGELSQWIPADRPGDFNEALMDLGATVCLPSGMPLCDRCPWNSVCIASKSQATQQYPKRAQKKARRIEKKTVFLLLDGDCVALRKRPEGGLLENLWEFPNAKGWLDAQQMVKMFKGLGVHIEEPVTLGACRHVFTHLEWHMRGFRADALRADSFATFSWVPLDQLESDYPIPSAFRFYLDALLETAK